MASRPGRGGRRRSLDPGSPTELLVLLFGVGPLQVILAAAVAMLTTAFFVFSSLPLIHAGVAAIIVVATQSPESGGGRLLDGLVGGGVALFVSQILFTPSPVSLLTNAVREVLGAVAGSLRATARALADDDAETAADALRRLRENQDSLSDLADARETSRGVARRTLRGRREAGRSNASTRVSRRSTSSSPAPCSSPAARNGSSTSVSPGRSRSTAPSTSLLVGSWRWPTTPNLRMPGGARVTWRTRRSGRLLQARATIPTSWSSRIRSSWPPRTSCG